MTRLRERLRRSPRGSTASVAGQPGPCCALRRLPKSARRGYNRPDEATLPPRSRQLALRGIGAAGRLCCGAVRLAGDSPAFAASLSVREPTDGCATHRAAGLAPRGRDQRRDPLVGRQRAAGQGRAAAGDCATGQRDLSLADRDRAPEPVAIGAALPATACHTGH